MADNTKYTLFTNITFVQFQNMPLRMQANAILLEDGGETFLGMPPYKIRGFGPDPAWSVFSYWLKEPIKYSLKSAQDNSAVMMSRGKLKPIFGGTILSIENGPELFMQSNDSKKPLDMFTCTGEILKVWDELEKRTSKYFTTPYIPHSSYGPNPLRKAEDGTRHPR